MSNTDSDDLEPQRGYMAPLWMRRLFGYFGVGTDTNVREED